jgi:hypothetical protein
MKRNKHNDHLEPGEKCGRNEDIEWMSNGGPIQLRHLMSYCGSLMDI